MRRISIFQTKEGRSRIASVSSKVQTATPKRSLQHQAKSGNTSPISMTTVTTKVDSYLLDHCYDLIGIAVPIAATPTTTSGEPSTDNAEPGDAELEDDAEELVAASLDIA